MRMTFLRGATAVAGLALAIGWAMAATPTAHAKYTGSLLWHEREHHQGGFSGLEVSDDGTAFTTITDRGIVHILFTEIGPRMEGRDGGYTRVSRIGNRNGDNEDNKNDMRQ